MIERAGFRIPLAALLFLSSVTHSHACKYCDERVKFTENMSVCFLEDYETQLQELRGGESPVILIDLSTCNAERCMRNLPSPGNRCSKITKTFLLDSDGVRCLASALQNADWKQKEVQEFSFRVGC